MKTASPISQTIQKSNALPSIKELFKESWQAFTKSILNLFLLSIISLVIGLISFGIFMGVVIAWVASLGIFKNMANIQKGDFSSLTNVFTPQTFITAGIFLAIFIIISAIISFIMQISSILVVAKYQEQPSLGSIIKKSFGYIVPLFLVGLLTGLLSLGGLFVFIIPVFFFCFFFMFVSYEVILADKKWLNAIKGSVQIISQHFGEILIRLIVYFLIYIVLFVFIPNIIRKIEPETYIYLMILYCFTNVLICWYGFAFSVTLYKQAKSVTDENKPVSLAWVWIIAILGWLIMIGTGLITVKILQTDMAKQALSKISEQINLASSKNNTNWKEKMNPEAKIHYDKTQELFKQLRTTTNSETLRSLIEQTIQEAKLATDVQSNNPMLWSNLGDIYTWLDIPGSSESALNAYKKAEELDSNNAVYINYVGDQLIRMKKYEEAVLQFQKTLRITDKSGYANLSLGIAYKNMRMVENAKQHLQKAIDIFTAENKDGVYDDDILKAKKELETVATPNVEAKPNT